MELEQGTFTPLVFTTTGGMAEECKRYHNRLAELLAIKKEENYIRQHCVLAKSKSLLCYPTLGSTLP